MKLRISAKTSNLVRKTFYPFIGIAALVWFLIRVIPKPSRATYPCQQAAFPLASGFVIWLAALFSSWAFYRTAKEQFVKSRRMVALGSLAIAVFAAGVAIYNTPVTPVFAAIESTTHFEPTEINQPVGSGKGVFPGRVVWLRDSTVAKWNGTDGYMWDEENTNVSSLEKMFSLTIRRLAGKSTDAAAWDALIRSFNMNYGRGDQGLQPGQKIAIKLNNNAVGNNGRWTVERPYVSPFLTYFLADHLINVVGFKGSDITFFDASRAMGNPGPIIEKIRSNPDSNFQNIRFKKSPKYSGTEQTNVEPDLSRPCYFADSRVFDNGQVYFPKCVTEADYLINIALFRAHSLAGITVCAKNHFGSVYLNSMKDTWTGGWRPNGNDAYQGFHQLVKASANAMGSANLLVELMGHKDLGGKTLLCLVDGLYSSVNQSSEPATYKIFNDRWPSSLFASQDQVAIESVILDFLRNEPTVNTHVVKNSDNFLHEAALADAPPSESFYDPENDGTRLASLGVHEHWNNFEEKKYSRNLGTDEGIELLAIDTVFDASTNIRHNGFGHRSARSFELNLNYPNPFNPVTTISYSLEKPADIVLKIYNNSGQDIRTLVSQRQPSGHYKVQWDGTNQAGVNVSSGIYYSRIENGKQAQSIKMSLIR